MTSIRPVTSSDYGIVAPTGFAPTKKTNPFKDAYEKVKEEVMIEQIKKKPQEERTASEKTLLFLHSLNKIKPTVMYMA